jgi:hypothetical protein
MKKTKIVQFAQGLLFLPIMTMVTPLGSIPNAGTFQVSMVAPSNQVAPVDPALQVEADAIDAYFAAHDMPLEGQGMKMAQAAADNDIDWRLLPAIAVRESSGGKNACKNNPFGWGSCKISFKSVEEGIDTVAANLGGNNPKTAQHYDNKTVKQILHAYNPPSIVPRYAEQVMAIMKSIGPLDLATTIPTPNSNA